MRASKRPGFFWEVSRWTIILLIVPACAQILGGSPLGEKWTLWEGVYLFTSWVGLFLPFAAFAGGIVGSARLSPLRLAASGLAVSFVSFLLLGFASPYSEYKTVEQAGLDTAMRFPTGPATIGGLRELRVEVLEYPAEEFRYSAEHPLDSPPNWIDFRIHTSFVFSLFAILAVFLGAITAGLTSGLSPPARRNVRWAIGLASGVLFFVVEALGGEWARADPLNSGLFAAWGPLLLPALEFGALYLLLLKRSRTDPTLFKGSPSNG